MANGTHTPSTVALENEKRVTALEEGHKDLVGKMGEMVGWMRKIESTVESNNAALTLKLDAISASVNEKFERVTHKPASTYIGIITLLFGAIGSAAALIVFVQDARLEPLRNKMEEIQRDDDRSFDQWTSDYSLLIRNDQALIDRGLKGSIDSKEKKNYSQPKYSHHGRPTP